VAKLVSCGVQRKSELFGLTGSANTRCGDLYQDTVTFKLVWLGGSGLLGEAIFLTLENGEGRHVDRIVAESLQGGSSEVVEFASEELISEVRVIGEDGRQGSR
jgi:hypothetical protein